MPYEKWTDVNTAIRGIKPQVTLEQANLIARWADAIESGDNPPDSPWAAAIAQFKKAYEVKDGKWVKQEGSSASNMLTVCTLMDTQATQRQYQGRDYLVSPAILIKEGVVMNGELPDAEEVSHLPYAWAGRPLVMDHPKDAAGDLISANDPTVLDTVGLGWVFNPEWRDGALHVELWTDIAKAQVKGGSYASVLNKQRVGEPIEISSAYFRDRDFQAGESGGRPFFTRAFNMRPDHVAVIMDGQGACSWEDGCGAPRVNMAVNIRSSARTPDYKGTETTSWESANKSLAAYIAGYYKHSRASKPDEPVKTVGDMPAAMKTWIASKSLLGDAGADEFSDLLFFPVVNPGTNKLNAGALQAVISGRGAQAKIAEGAKSSAQERARGLIDKEFQSEKTAAQRLVAALNSIVGMVGAHITLQEADQMDENRTLILDDGRFGLSQELVEGLSDDAAEKFAAFIKDNPATEPKDKDEDPEGKKQKATEDPEKGEDDEEQGEDEKQAANVELPAEVAELAQFIKDAGGADTLKASLAELAQNAQQERAELVELLVANDACVVPQETLEQLPVTTLRALKASFIKPDYSGQGLVVASKDKITPLARPDVFAVKAD